MQIDQAEVVEIVHIRCEFEGGDLPVFEVGRMWPLSHLRQEVAIALGHDTPDNFGFEIGIPGQRNRKVHFWTPRPYLHT